MFLFLAFAGTQVANIGDTGTANTTTGQNTGFNPTVLLYVGVVFGFSLMVNVFIFFRVSGGLFNPAVSNSHSIDTQCSQTKFQDLTDSIATQIG